jgi:hypothetical protein
MSEEAYRQDPPPRGDERELLTAFLDFQRGTLEWKCSALTQEQLVRVASPPSSITLLGLLRHLAGAEKYWFLTVLMGRDAPSVYPGEDAWEDLTTHSPEEVLRRWKGACETSRRNVASIASFDLPAARPRFWDEETVNLRWIMIHLIEEYARHVGHADLLRERIDGRTGE